MGFHREAARMLIMTNAMSCELATGHFCRCACGGALHGIAHSAEWREKTLDEQEWRASGYQLSLDLEAAGEGFYGLTVN